MVETEGLAGRCCPCLHLCCEQCFPEDWPVFIKVDSLLISMELVPKMFACLVDLVTHCEVSVLAEVLMIEIVKFLRVLCVKNVTRLDPLVENDVYIVVPALNLCSLWYWCIFVIAVMML